MHRPFPWILMLLAIPAFSAPSWERVCQARQSFFEFHLQPENYQSVESILDDLAAEPGLDLLVLSDIHYQPSLSRLTQMLGHLARRPEFNCLFIEATETSWRDDEVIAQTFESSHPLYYIRKFQEDLKALPLDIYFIDRRDRLNAWLTSHWFPLSTPELKELSYEEYTYRNQHMSQQITEHFQRGFCQKALVLVGPNHLSRSARGFEVASLKDLLTAQGFQLRSMQLVDSEIMLGLDYTLNHSVPSPTLCFSNCPSNPPFPSQEIAFVHQIETGDAGAPPLIETERLDPHYGSALQGLWTDFDATVIFPPLFINSCQDRRF